MAQAVSYGSITIVDTNDIESITIEYARNQSTSNPPAQDSSDWSTTRPDWAQGYYIWQRARIHKSGTETGADTFGAAVCLTGSTGQSGTPGQSLTATKTQYTNAASNVTITENNHTSYTWTDSTPEYDATKPVYWGRITNTYTNPAKTEYLFYKDQALTDAIYNAYIANSIATHAQEDAEGALSQSTDALQRVQAKYGTSSTGASTVAKVANCEGFQLFNGAEIFISFTNKNTATNPTLNVNNTGAKPIKDSDGNTLAEKFYWKDNSLVHFVYDGTNWRILDIVTTEKYNNLVSDINGVSQTVGQHTTQISGLGTRVSTAETNITQNTNAISLRATKTEAQGYANTAESNAKDYTDGEITTAKAEIKVTTDGISTEVSNKVGNNEVISKINQSAESITINANRVNIEGATIFTGSGRLSQTSLNNAYDVKGAAATAESNAINTANSAAYEEQYVYISKVSGTTSVSKNETWVTRADDVQNIWTTKRPTYNTNYPVLFVAKQKKTVGQSSGNTCTCTTPVKDDTTTVIDGGHITTGTIDASRLNVNDIISSGSIVVNRDISDMATKTYVGNQGYQTLSNVNTIIGQTNVSALNDGSDYTKTANLGSTTAVQNAAKTASNYLEDTDSQAGVTLKAVNGTTAANTSTSNYIKINTSGLGIFKGGVSVAQYGDTARIGKDSSINLSLASTGMSLNNVSDPIFNIQAAVSTETQEKNSNLTTFNTLNEVTAGPHVIQDNGIASNRNIGVIFSTTEGDTTLIPTTDYTLSVNTGSNPKSISVTLTTGEGVGVNKIKELMTIHAESQDEQGEDESQSGESEDDIILSGTLSVNYLISVYDKALINNTGRIKVTGEGNVIEVINTDWTTSNKTNTFIVATLAPTGQSQKQIALGIGSGGSNRGIYDAVVNNWLIHADANNKTLINGSNFNVTSSGKITNTYSIYTSYAGSVRHRVENTTKKKKIDLIAATDGSVGLYNPVTNTYLIRTNASGDTRVHGGAFIIPSSGTATLTRNLELKNGGDIILTNSTGGIAGRRASGSNTYTIGLVSSSNNVVIGDNDTPLILRGTNKGSKNTYILNVDGYLTLGSGISCEGAITCGGAITSGGIIHMPNNTAIRAKSKNGSTEYRLIAASDNNNILVGDDSSSGLYLYGMTYSSSSSGNVRVGILDSKSTGFMYYTTSSSKRYKHDIQNLEISNNRSLLNPSKLYDLPVHTFKYNNDYLSPEDLRSGKDIPGFIAEEVGEFYPIAMDRDEDGLPEDWNVRYIVPPMLALIQEQKKQIDKLEKRVAELEK